MTVELNEVLGSFFFYPVKVAIEKAMFPKQIGNLCSLLLKALQFLNAPSSKDRYRVGRETVLVVESILSTW